MIIKETLDINIVTDVLIRPEALNSYLGKEVNKYLLEKIEAIKEPTLINVHMRQANPIDYSFTKYAFGEFYNQVSSNTLLDTIFYLNKSQLRSLCWGLLEYQKYNTTGDANYEDAFKLNNSIKISISNQEINFIGHMSDCELQILEYINTNVYINEKDLYDFFTTKGVSYDAITDTIRNLKLKKFIYSDEVTFNKKIISIKHIRDNL